MPFIEEGAHLSETELDQFVGGLLEDAEKVGDAGRASSMVASKLAAQGARLSPESQARLATKFAAMAAGRWYHATAEHNLAQDDFGGNQLIPIDSGDVLVGPNADTGTFIVTVNTTFRWIDAVVTNEMATKFGLTISAVAGFSSMSQGFNIAGVSPTNQSLSLAPFTPDYDRYRMNPFLGREYNANTSIQIRAHEIAGASARFMMALVIQLQGVNVPASRCFARSHYVRPCGR